MKNIAGAIDHLKNHQKYPASKAELVAECDSLSDFSEEDKMWFKDNLPNKTYDSSDEVINALGLREQPTQAM